MKIIFFIIPQSSEIFSYKFYKQMKRTANVFFAVVKCSLKFEDSIFTSISIHSVDSLFCEARCQLRFLTVSAYRLSSVGCKRTANLIAFTYTNKQKYWHKNICVVSLYACDHTRATHKFVCQCICDSGYSTERLHLNIHPIYKLYIFNPYMTVRSEKKLRNVN